MARNLAYIMVICAILFLGGCGSGKSQDIDQDAFSGESVAQNQSQSPGGGLSSNAAPIAPQLQDKKIWQAPLDRAKERVTKKYFGIFITSANSPVQSERFRGYHTGTDFEIFPEEMSADVAVKAICPGKLELKRFASGYGGVAVESCILDSQSVTVIYGHLKLASISKKTGDSLDSGEAVGILGADKSVETDGERKHLHLGVHKGTAISILGYVQQKRGLNGWLDPCTFVCD